MKHRQMKWEETRVPRENPQRHADRSPTKAYTYTVKHSGAQSVALTTRLPDNPDS